MRIAALLMSLSLVLTACSSGGGGDEGSGAVGVDSASAMIGTAGGTVGDTSNAYIVIPAGALTQNTLISLEEGSDIELPAGFIATGPAVEASPDGLVFENAATIAIPVDPALVPDGVTLADLVVYRRESDGTIAPVPVLGYDDNADLIYAAAAGFTTFQTAVSDGTFAIIPQTSLLETENVFFSEALELAEDAGTEPITFALVQTSKVDGVTSTDAVVLEGEVAPGVTVSTTGEIEGTPTERGTWAFSVQATDSTSPTALTATISLTLTVAANANTAIDEDIAEDGLDFTYDDEGNLFVLGVTNGTATLVKVTTTDLIVAVTTVEVAAGVTSPAFAVSPDGTAVVVVYEAVIGGDPYNQQIFAVEYDSDLTEVTPAFRIDADPVIDPLAPDETLSDVRQALRPGVAFALNRTIDDGEEEEEEEPQQLYLVAYEQARNTDADGALRADVYGRWREFGGDTLTDEIRLDVTSDAGQTSGDPVIVVGNEAGCLVLWTDQGGTNGDESATAEPGTPGDIMAVLLPSSDVSSGAEEEAPTLPIVVTPAEPAAINDEAGTTGLHPNAITTPDNRFVMVWTERDDTPTPSPDDDEEGSESGSGRASQKSGILYRRPLTLRCADVTSGSAATSFLVDDTPVDGSIYAGAVAVDAEGEIAIAWVKSFTDGEPDTTTFLRRFSSAGTPLENSLEAGAGDPLALVYTIDGILAVASASGDTGIESYTLEPDEPEEEP
ncbi:MAG: hypothetical protein L6Q71_02070 [Planctomycetes bacterium]|nr:hypothetical protein [Planctomycetota bacterium]NUQ34345.1 hypothetical protein [Planctomycetaceae bacterium]